MICLSAIFQISLKSFPGGTGGCGVCWGEGLVGCGGMRCGGEVRYFVCSSIVLLECLLINLFQSCTGHVLCSILLNSADLLRVDLQGVQVLLPHLITALETVLPRNDIQIR